MVSKWLDFLLIPKVIFMAWWYIWWNLLIVTLFVKLLWNMKQQYEIYDIDSVFSNSNLYLRDIFWYFNILITLL